MNSSSILDRLTQIFQLVFDDQAIRLSPETTAKDIKRWDSLSHVDMILTVEQEFCVRIPTSVALRLKNVGELAAFLSNTLSNVKQ